MKRTESETPPPVGETRSLPASPACAECVCMTSGSRHDRCGAEVFGPVLDVEVDAMPASLDYWRMAEVAGFA